MEAATLPKKKNSINKGKLKKTIKNVLCRSDSVFWPSLPEQHEKTLQMALTAYKVNIPKFEKLHWNKLKLIPKDKRPRPPKIEKVNGLLFGISECLKHIENDDCSAIILESSVSPQIIVQPILEACISAKVPIICLNNLRSVSASNFGISTSCLGIKKNFFLELKDKIIELTKYTKLPNNPQNVIKKEADQKDIVEDIESVEPTPPNDQNIPQYQYLYRENKKHRVFLPSGEVSNSNMNKFSNQSFIKLFENQNEKTAHGHYAQMTLKRISSNLNRKRKSNTNN